MDSVSRFRQSLDFGKAAESKIAMWMIRNGWSVLPVYEKIINEGKGPQVFTPDGGVIAPDLFVFRGKMALWIEAKHKTTFTYYRNGRRWTTGIDRRHYIDYCKIDDESPWPVCLYFLHLGGKDKDTGEESPSGLFGNYLSYLRANESHQSDRMGKSGMVYWAIDSLEKLASLEQIDGEIEQEEDLLLYALS